MYMYLKLHNEGLCNVFATKKIKKEKVLSSNVFNGKTPSGLRLKVDEKETSSPLKDNHNTNFT